MFSAKKIFFVAIVALSMMSCSQRQETYAPTQLTRLDALVAQIASTPGNDAFALDSQTATALGDYLYMMGFRDGELVESADSLAATAAFKAFYPLVDECFTDTKEIEAELGRLGCRLEIEMPEIGSRQFYGIVSPYRQKIMSVDSIVFIALNHYLGSDADPYEGMPAFERATKIPRQIPTDVAEAIVASAYPYERGSEPALLNRLLYEGALTEAVMRLTGETSPQLMLGWTDDQLSLVRSEEKRIWESMIANQLVYSPDESLAERMVAPAVATYMISPDFPGRVGRYIGWRIVKAYLGKNGDLSIRQMLSPEFYNDNRTLLRAEYRPQ